MLTKLQHEIVTECLRKRRGCMCVPMGTGKTLMSLTMTRLIGDDMPALIVCSKTLIGSWIAEIEKFFGKSIRYEVYHSDYMKKDFKTYIPNADIDVVITTADVIVKAYSKNHVRDKFTTLEAEERGAVADTMVRRYHVPTKPFLLPTDALTRPNAFIYGITWKILIIDEVQQYTNIDCQRCEALSAIHAKYRWVTSGTPITEPQVLRVMGYYMLIGDTTFPNCKPDAERYIRSNEYPGIKPTMVIRTQEEVDFTLPNYSETIISHDLTIEEEAIYSSLKKIVESLIEAKLNDRYDTIRIRRINAELLEILTYLRQFLVCPLIPFSSLMLNNTDNNSMKRRLEREMGHLNLREWLDNPDVSRSSRIRTIIETIQKHPEERCIIFSCFRTNLNVIKEYVTKDTGRETFTIDSKDSISKRSAVITDFEATGNGILVLTYGLGAEGLNLQKSHVMLLADVWWNDAKISQAIARILRRGQEHDVSVYFFTSNTGMESGLYEKHIDKRTMIESLMTGKLNGKVKTVKMAEIINLILKQDNTDKLQNARDLVSINKKR